MHRWIVLAAFVAIACHRHDVSRSRIDGVYMVPGGVVTLAVSEQFKDGAKDGHALATIEISSGRSVARKLTPGPEAFVTGNPHELWFRDAAPDMGLIRRDPHTLEITMTQATWLARNPAIVAPIELIGNYSANDKLAIGLRDASGHYFWFDPDTLRARPADGAPPVEPDGQDFVAPAVADSADMPDGGVAHLVGDALQCGSAAPSAVTFPRAQLVRNHAAEHGVWLRDPDGVLLVAPASTAAGAPLVLSRVPCTGPALWSTPLLATSLAGVKTGGHDVILVTVEPEGDAVADYDLDTGVENWRHAF